MLPYTYPSLCTTWSTKASHLNLWYRIILYVLWPSSCLMIQWYYITCEAVLSGGKPLKTSHVWSRTLSSISFEALFWPLRGHNLICSPKRLSSRPIIIKSNVHSFCPDPPPFSLFCFLCCKKLFKVKCWTKNEDRGGILGHQFNRSL